MNSISVLIKEIRVYQWVKNILIFSPLLLSHTFTDTERLIDSFIAFIAFCLCASSVYIINDLCDIEADRKHPIKKNRPIAAGLMSIDFAKVIALLLIVVSAVIAYLQSREFFFVLLGYFSLTLAYSFSLKTFAIVDVLILGGLYTLRIVAGVIVINVEISYWLVVFSLFIFISLAILKRYTELMNMKSRNETDASHRGYEIADADLLSKMGIVSSYIAILVVALYIHDPLVITKYTQPLWLWAVIPAMFYWLSRVWLLASRGEMQEDPVLFALRDKTSYFLIVICLFSILLAM